MGNNQSKTKYLEEDDKEENEELVNGYNRMNKTIERKKQSIKEYTIECGLKAALNNPHFNSNIYDRLQAKVKARKANL